MVRIHAGQPTHDFVLLLRLILLSRRRSFDLELSEKRTDRPSQSRASAEPSSLYPRNVPSPNYVKWSANTLLTPALRAHIKKCEGPHR